MPDTWPTPRIWVAGERVSAVKMNEISAALNALYPFVSGGDMAYRDPSNDYLVRLAKGTAYQQFRMNSGADAPEWGGFIAGMAYLGSNQSIANNTSTNVQFTSAPISQLVTWSAGDNTKLTVGVSGAYLFGFTYKFDGGGSVGFREANIVKNGSTTLLESRISNADGEATMLPGIDIAILNSGDYLQLRVRQNSGAPLNLSEAELFAVFIGAQNG